MNILLTGSTGYLGSNLAKELTQRGYSVACVVRNKNKLGRLNDLRRDVLILSIDDMQPDFRRIHFDVVIHTACTYERGGSTLHDVLEGNFYFPMQVFQLALKSGVKRWINTGTCLPPETNSYALAKSQFVQWGKYFAEKGELQFINLVLEHFYGPAAPENQFIGWVIRKLRNNEPLRLTEGKQRRDFIYIDDVLHVYNEVACSDFSQPFIEIPVGTGVSPTIREVVQYLKAITGSHSELYFGAVPTRQHKYNSCCDTALLRSMDILPKMDWKAGMEMLLNRS